MQEYETLELKNIQYEKGDDQGRYDYYSGIIWVDEQDTIIEKMHERYLKHVVNNELAYINGSLCYIYEVTSILVVKNDKTKPFYENCENGSYQIYIEYHELSGPEWDRAPIWADYLTQCPCTGNYIWHQNEPFDNKYKHNYNTQENSCTRIAQFGFQYPKEHWKSQKWDNPKGIRAIY